jgi:hypothetical protein
MNFELVLSMPVQKPVSRRMLALDLRGWWLPLPAESFDPPIRPHISQQSR